MAHYAFLNEDNIVTNVITGKDETDTSHNWEEYYGNFHSCVCKRTSYNTYENKHLLGGTPFRGNYAAIGYTYFTPSNIFMPPKPYASWSLDVSNAVWVAPISKPDDGKNYVWNEDSTNWIESIPLS